VLTDDLNQASTRELLTKRIGAELVEKRIAREERKERSLKRVESGLFTRMLVPKNVINVALKASGMNSRGVRNALNIQCRTNQIFIPNLPAVFHGYKILQISDLHIDVNPDFTEALTNKLIDCVRTINCDACVLTGDYRYRSFGPIENSMSSVKRIVESINSNCYAILGNHDSIDMVPAMESYGINVLMNEHVTIEKSNASFVLIGVDDPNYYRTDDLARATATIQNSDSVKILLAHSPELYNEAQRLCINAYLCGHTHGGQICLPGGKPILKNFRSPRWTSAGKWQYKGMEGYTSVGVGVSVSAARFNCLPEITIHELMTNMSSVNE